MELVIDQMRAEDWKQVLEIYHYGMETGNATFEMNEPDWKSWEDWDRDHLKWCRLVVREGEHVLGWASLLPISAREAYQGVAEVSIYLHKDSTGKGVGTKLMQALIEESEAAGMWMLQSEIFPENTGSLKLHEKMGFRKVGFREKIGQMEDGRWRDVVLVERRSPHVGLD
ncbi:GNAT family N-acetyltransferase [Oceanobacillus neutriphilus]|uniref:Phosphinothricin N-acetyltransferase n=1 Tax=Oceanobacillus neutriphilus TaxID=531815 RepID=A0ABQ2NXN9_9BACI|nr:GNAT family N-acetyltransferase [Oceanobacillus neutriphilus]GGP13204.1 phosphinothricin N-acetyltransferase [Oceanobacillus neutriphilus]